MPNVQPESDRHLLRRSLGDGAPASVRTTLTLLLPHIAGTLVRKLSHGDALDPVETLRGAVTIVDMVVFARLVGSLSDEGAQGIYAFHHFLSIYYSGIVRLVSASVGVI